MIKPKLRFSAASTSYDSGSDYLWINWGGEEKRYVEIEAMIAVELDEDDNIIGIEIPNFGKKLKEIEGGE